MVALIGSGRLLHVTQERVHLFDAQALPGAYGRVAGQRGEQGFFALENWVLGAQFDGCEEADTGAVVCNFSRDGSSWVVAWAQSGEVPFTAPEGTALVCDPLANCTESTPGAEVVLTEVPVRFYTQ